MRAVHLVPAAVVLLALGAIGAVASLDRPTASPNPSPIRVEIPNPSNRRRMLAALSVHNTYSPDRRSGSAASRFVVWAISLIGGNSLSSGLAARRSAEPMM